MLGLIAIGAAGLVIVDSASQVAPTEPPAQAVVKQIRQAETSVIAPATLEQTVKVTGTLAPSRQADVAAQVSAQVLEVMVSPGDAVQAGQVLVRLDSEALAIALDQERATAEAMQAQLISAEQQLQRTEELAGQRLATPSALEQAQSAADALRSNLAALEQAVKAAELSLANATLTAPIAGIVSSRAVEPGQSVASGTSLITIVDLDTMEYSAAASVGASPLIKPGQVARLTVGGLEDEVFSGVVTRVNPVATTGTRSLPIYIRVDNPGQILRGGMFASGIITVEEKPDAIAVPARALREDASGGYLLGLSDDTVVRHDVETEGAWNDGLLVEVAGVEVGTRIVTTPLSQLEPGDRFSLVRD